jgi:hypothetical protein
MSSVTLVRNRVRDMDEGKADYNFDAEDLKRLERIRDLPTLKTQALALISRPSAKPMKPEKVEWFKNALDRMNSPIKVIKLMYDLLLSGEGHAVVGSKIIYESQQLSSTFWRARCRGRLERRNSCPKEQASHVLLTQFISKVKSGKTLKMKIMLRSSGMNKLKS